MTHKNLDYLKKKITCPIIKKRKQLYFIIIRLIGGYKMYSFVVVYNNLKTPYN